MHIPIQIYFVSAEIRHGWVKVSTWKSSKIYRPAKDQQKRKPVTLMVSIPRSLVSVQASTGLYMSPGVFPQLSLSLCSEEQPADDPHLTVSLPLSTFVNSHVRSLQQLTSRVSTLTVSLPWVITSHLPLILCRIEVSSDQ